MRDNFRAGFVTLIGKPNVGKSTLINQLIGEKIAIVSPRPQTTRNVIKGIVTFDEAQVIFLDTPGIISLNKTRTLVDRHIIEEALRSLEGIDLIAIVVEPFSICEEDKFILQKLKEINKPAFLVINKIDKIKESQLESLKKGYSDLFLFSRIIPISAKKGTNLSIFMGEIIQHLPYHSIYYPSDFITDQPERILVSELIREKIFILTRAEIPYSTMVKVSQFEEREEGPIYIRVVIYVEQKSQKGILIGKSGKMIKEIGSLARKEIEKRLGCQVYLDLWVAVKKNWRRQKKSLKEMGYAL
jgi:GTP-binding protein Era